MWGKPLIPPWGMECPEWVRDRVLTWKSHPDSGVFSTICLGETPLTWPLLLPSGAVEREMHGRLCRQFADAEINGEGTNPAFFRLGMLGIIKGEGTMPDGPAGSGRKVSCADEGNRMSRGGGRTLRVASAEMA